MLKKLVCICVFSLLCSTLNAETVLDFEGSAYTSGAAINGQDGWSELSGTTVITDNSGSGGSQVIDFTPSVSSSVHAIKTLDKPYSTVAHIEYDQKWTYDKSGGLGFLNTSGVNIFNVYIAKVGVPVWQIGGGADGYVYPTAAMPNTIDGVRFIRIVIDVDFDADTADVYWCEIGETSLNTIITGYSLNASDTFAQIDVTNSKTASQFDNISVDEVVVPTAPLGTFIDFESPLYTAGAAINGQDGWSESYGTTIITDNSVSGGSQVIDFTPSIGVMSHAVKALDATYSATAHIEYDMKWLYDKSGGLGFLNTSGVNIFNVYIAKVGVPVWQIGGGADGYVYPAAAMPNTSDGVRFIRIVIDVDFDADTADVYWREIGETSLNTIITGYTLNVSDTFASIDVTNSKIAAQFDNIAVTEIPVATCQELWDSGNGIQADLNKDCYINFEDLAILAADWMQCIDPAISSCN